jgi:hypothetical protein
LGLSQNWWQQKSPHCTGVFTLPAFMNEFKEGIRPYQGTVWMVGVNIYPKENDLPLPFAPTNICPFGVFGWRGKCGCGWERESGTHHKFAPICYLLGVNGIRGAKHLPHHICPTCLAP